MSERLTEIKVKYDQQMKTPLGTPGEDHLNDTGWMLGQLEWHMPEVKRLQARNKKGNPPMLEPAIIKLYDRMSALEVIIAMLLQDTDGTTPDEFKFMLKKGQELAATARKARLDERIEAFKTRRAKERSGRDG